MNADFSLEDFDRFLERIWTTMPEDKLVRTAEPRVSPLNPDMMQIGMAHIGPQMQRTFNLGAYGWQVGWLRAASARRRNFPGAPTWATNARM